MATIHETFFTAVGCMDGRVQDVISAFGREKFGVQFADTVTEAGIVGLLAKDNPDKSVLDGVKFKACDVSVGMHHAAGIVVHGHSECAGNPVDNTQQIADIKKSVKVIQSLAPSVPVIGVFVHRSSEDASVWEVEEVC